MNDDWLYIHQIYGEDGAEIKPQSVPQHLTNLMYHATFDKIKPHLVVEPWRGADGEEELASVGVGPRVGHAQRVGPVVAQARVQLVLELPAPDGLAAGADPGRVAGLEVGEKS